MAKLFSKTFYRGFSHITHHPGALFPPGNHAMSNTPIFYQEILSTLRPQKDQTFVDMTFGDGGHSGIILRRQENCRLFAFDKNIASIDLGKRIWETYNPDFFKASVSRFSDLPTHFKDLGIQSNEVDGVLLDCGVSNLQLMEKNGLSGQGPLDLRLDPLRMNNLKTGIEYLRCLTSFDLFYFLKDMAGLGHQSVGVLQALLTASNMMSDSFTTETLFEILLDHVKFSKERKALFLTLNEATVWEFSTTCSILQSIITALRMAVNDELNQLKIGVGLASHYLKPGGKLIVIVRNEVEEQELLKIFSQLDESSSIKTESDDLATYPLKTNNLGPLNLRGFDKAIHPDVKFARMYVATKI